uniref:RRM domain-containing protein n=1 Tax=Oreochromis niloticus TaxID=8128 RepID=A0A669DMM9_ORENI
MEAEVVDFRVPVESNKTVLVWDIPPTFGEAHIHARLHAIFSSFGPVYLLKVSPNAPLHPPGFYALIKFFSAAHAAAAQRVTDGRPLLDDSPLKVKLSSKQMPHFLSGSSRPLSHTHCLELANHVLGFNGWTSDIITLKELTNEEEGEEEEGGGASQRRLKFGCVLQLCFPHHGQMSRGAAVLEDCFTCTGECGVSATLWTLLPAGNLTCCVWEGGCGGLMPLIKPSHRVCVCVCQVNEFSWTEGPADEEEADDAEWALTVS